MTSDPSFIPYRRAAAYLKDRLDDANIPCPVVGIICGSGLSGLSKALSEPLTIPYREIPGFPSKCTVAGHTGEIVFGNLGGGVATVCLRGRFHSYEGHDMSTVALPVRVMRCLGVKLLIVTNAAGALNPEFEVGDVVTIMDYIAIPMLGGKNPLVGPNDDELGPRFPPTSNAFDDSLQAVVVKAGRSLKFSSFIKVHGTYCFVSGPMYESKAECRILRSFGGDCVGMSTVPEIVAAHHCGIKVICLSLITNKVIISGIEGPAASHQEVLEEVNKRSEQMQSLVKETVRILPVDKIPDLPPINLDIETEEATLKKTEKREFVLCPYHLLKSTPGHCMLMGCAMIALGSLLGSKILKR